LKPEGEPVRVDVTSTALQLLFDDTDTTETVPLSGLRVRAGGFDVDRVIVEWSEGGRERTLFVKDRDTIVRLSAAAPPELRTSLDQAARRMRSARRGPMTLFLVGVVATLLLFLTLWLSFDAIVGAVVKRMPRSWEASLGESAYRSVIAGQVTIDSGPPVEAVAEITDRLARRLLAGGDSIRVTVIRNPDVNAFALPGGRVVVHSGLIAEAGSAEELAGVLSHEISHVTLRHSIRRMVRGAGFSAVLAIVLGNQEGLAKAMGSAGMQLVSLRFDREQEAEADREGVKLLDRAGISPEGMITFFERLAEEEPRGLAILSTHPMSAERAESIRRELAARSAPLPPPLPIDWERVREAAASPGP
jgi:Zn-dependent protease with chaperone function